MLYLILSIFLSATLFICFKWFDTKNVELLPAISGNYISCILTGIIMEGGLNIKNSSIHVIGYCIVLGILFFAIFYAMGYASSKIGVGISSASAKLSLIIPVTYGAIALQEDFGIGKITALILAIPAVLLMTYKPGEKIALKTIAIPFAIFIGSGIIDTGLNLLEKNLNGLPTATAIVYIFGTAFICSLIVSTAIKKPVYKNIKSMRFGLILGVPNYFSVYFMLLALGSGAFSSGQFYMINNTGVMLVSFVFAALLFSEKINLYKAIGLLMSIISIYLVLYT